MKNSTFGNEIRRRLATDESDRSLRHDIRDLILSRLQTADPLTYCVKDNLGRAITSLRQNSLRPGHGTQHPKLWHALLQYELSLLDENDREDEHPHADDIIQALSREMLLEAALRID